MAKDLCGAKTKSGGKCQNAAGKGTSHVGVGYCKFHGGSSPTHVKQAEKIMAQEAVATYGLPRDIDPHEALIEEVRRTAGTVGWLESIIREHDEADLVWGVTKEVEDVTGKVTEREYKAAPSVWLQLYQKERRKLVDVCKTAIACGIAERQVRIAEDQAMLIAEGFRAFARMLAERYGFDPDGEDVRKFARQSLVLIEGGKG